MVKKNGAIVFSAEPDQIDNIIDQFSKNFDAELIHCQASYSKLWIKKESTLEELFDDRE
jgi:hypothetical protein